MKRRFRFLSAFIVILTALGFFVSDRAYAVDRPTNMWEFQNRGLISITPYVENATGATEYSWTLLNRPIEQYSNKDMYEEWAKYKQNSTSSKLNYWYAKGTVVNVEPAGYEAVIKEPAEGSGKHLYSFARKGMIPVAYWECGWTTSACIHRCTENSPYKGISYTKQNCGHSYFSGWFGYCADCGQRINDCFVYSEPDKLRQLTAVDVSMFYYYKCPNTLWDEKNKVSFACDSMELTATDGTHQCRQISNNRYVVAYYGNFAGAVDGSMDISTHYYEDADSPKDGVYYYEGVVVEQNSRLSKNTFVRSGYAFKGWATSKDGPVVYADEAVIRNLTTENYYENGTTGIIKLYAVWEPANATLEIDPGQNASYNGKSGITTITQGVGTQYHVRTDTLSASALKTVKFDSKGGSSIADKAVDRKFSTWSKTVPFKGMMASGSYKFPAMADAVDRITALYYEEPIVLPTPVWAYHAFAGWYTSADYAVTSYVGSGGTKYLPVNNGTTILYAKWSDLNLTTVNNYIDNNKKGAVDATWGQDSDYGLFYELYRSTNSSVFADLSADISAYKIGKMNGSMTPPEAVNFADTSVSGSTKSYSIKETGVYTITARGGRGGNYTKADGTTYSGGKGAEVKSGFFLKEGDILYYAVGGNGTDRTAGTDGSCAGGKSIALGSTGGKADKYASGGGATTVILKRDGVQTILLVAGGGGGATDHSEGYAGSVLNSLADAGTIVNQRAGQNGASGGGGGYRGGKSGVVIYHVHTEECYNTKSGTNNLNRLDTITASVLSSNCFRNASTGTTGFTYTKTFVAGSADYCYDCPTDSVNLSPNKPSDGYSPGAKKAQVQIGNTGAGKIPTVPDSIQWQGVKNTVTDFSASLTFNLYASLRSGSLDSPHFENLVVEVFDAKDGTTSLGRWELMAGEYKAGTTVTNALSCNHAYCQSELAQGRIVMPSHVKTITTTSLSGTGISGYKKHTSYSTTGSSDSTQYWSGGGHIVPGREEVSASFTLPLTKNVEGVIIKAYEQFRDDYNRQSEGDCIYAEHLRISDLTYNYNYKILTCGKDTTTPESAYGGYGGTSYADTTAMQPVVSDTLNAPAFGLKSVLLGVSVLREAKAVPAPDLAKPYAIDTNKVKKEAITANTWKINFETPKDRGTDYYFLACSYKMSDASRTGRSGITSNNLTTGVKGYYAIVNTASSTTVTSANGQYQKSVRVSGEDIRNQSDGFVTTENVNVTLSDPTKTYYLHIAPVDVAGNVGDTVHIRLDPYGDDHPNYNVATAQISITDKEGSTYDYKSIYPKAGGGYYVRADGTPCFFLSFDAFLDGVATDTYQIDKMSLVSNKDSAGKAQVFTYDIPYTVPFTNGVNLSVGGIKLMTSGTQTLLKSGNFAKVNKNSKSIRNTLKALAGMDTSLDGVTIVVTPTAGATFTNDLLQKELNSSIWAEDVTHSIKLTGDGKAPVISGNTELIRYNTGEIEADELPSVITLQATDALSGVRLMEVTVTNQNNMYTKTYTGTDSVVLNLGAEPVLFNGDVQIKVKAVDNVGNSVVVKLFCNTTT